MRTIWGLIALLGSGSLTANGADDPRLEFFERKIRPVLVEHCYECHANNAAKLGGNLRLDSRPGLLTGGDSGAALKPGDPTTSLLLKAVRYDDEDLQMPPKGKLPPEVVADFEVWIKDGAIDPRDAPAKTSVAADWAAVARQRAEWWSLRPVHPPTIPQPRDSAWSEHSIDAFIRQRQETAGLTPTTAASPQTLVRRLSLVLTGLPPTAEQVRTFVHSCEEARFAPGSSLPAAAVETLVDQLLASPHFGERWARHWLDVVRFTETHGNEWNYEVHHAWRYRDYLIRTLNQDVPYDQFVQEHLAGDLLPQPRWSTDGKFQESPIGTGFYRFGEVNHDDCISLPELGYDIADNQIDTLSKAFQALTVACSRCHDHKFDAVSTRDYYAVLGVVRSSRMAALTVDHPDLNVPVREQLRALKSQIRQAISETWRADMAELGRYLLVAAVDSNAPISALTATGFDGPRLSNLSAAVSAEKSPLEDLFEPWRRLAKLGDADPAAWQRAWKTLIEEYAREDHSRTDFNAANYQVFGDFRQQLPADWDAGGHALRSPLPHSGDFVVAPEGPTRLQAILPAGCFTNAESDKLNGTLRSPVVPSGKAHISFQVAGLRSSAVRLVSNNCQLNYKNYRALINPELHWITFSPPDNRDQLRTYAELMTMFDNPKFPDQLAALGGDGGNYRVPWEQAAANPRSFFGVTQVVLHDVGEPPRAGLGHLQRLFAGPAPASLAEFAGRYQAAGLGALDAWAADRADDDDVRWLSRCLSLGFLKNAAGRSPRLDGLIDAYRRIEAGIPLPTVVAGVSEGHEGYDQPVLVRGNCRQPAAVVPRGYLDVLSQADEPACAPETHSTSGRWELAQRIADAQNPLTARVYVNRIWHHLFGTGLVRTVDDFGHGGEEPSHPDLLDHLAAEFVADGWSTKRLIRRIVLTRTFQLSSRPAAGDATLDPGNRLLHYYPARRLEAEGIRDAILATSGRLDPQLFGHSVQPYREKEYADRRLFPGPLDGGGRRSIYIRNTLMEPPRFLAVFNFPGGKVTQGRRDITNVPAQALALLNDPFVVQQAGHWAERLVQRPDSGAEARVDHMLSTALSRAPTDAERQSFAAVVRALAELHQVDEAQVMRSVPVWKDVAHAVFNLKEFIYVP